jgi:hypothetical protein
MALSNPFFEACLPVKAVIVGHPRNLGGVAISTVLLWLGTSLSWAWRWSSRSFLPGWNDWNLTGYWVSPSAYFGQEFPTKALIICLVAAVIPVIAAIPLFHKQAY